MIELKKIILALLVLFLLFSLSPKNCKLSSKANSTRTLIVGNMLGDFNTIQEAINNANPGDTIFVRNGTYHENVFINKSITLTGENREATIINGGEINSVITIEANNVTVQNFTIMKSGNSPPCCGISVKPIYQDNIINNNKIIENYYGVYLLSSNNKIYNNIISNNIYGVYLISCTNNVVSNNIINSSVYEGIVLQSAFDNFILDNIILFNYLSGISLYDSRSNWIYGNTIFSNSNYGINLYRSSNNVLSANTILNNLYGLFAFSSNNTIYHNNFNNKVHVWNVDSISVWSCNGEGNYWSDYVGVDLNEDGIGETPYVIDEDNADSGPLMGMFSKLDITYKGETYHVTTVSNSTISDFQFIIGTETANKIVRFKLGGNESSVGFCRVMIPTGLMSHPNIVLLGDEEAYPKFLDISNATHVYLYFTYLNKNQTVTIISFALYDELLDLYYNLNATYYALLDNYTILWNNYIQLQEDFKQLNVSYQLLCDLNAAFYDFLGNYSKLQENFYYLNETYYNLVNGYGELQRTFHDLNNTYYNLLNELILLLENYQQLNFSYQDHLNNYSQTVINIQNLKYILAVMTAILIIVTIYLSKHAQSNRTQN